MEIARVTIPANVHFTQFTGMIHSKDCRTFMPGSLASLGVEHIAEDGYGITLQNEISGLINEGKAKAIFLSVLPSVTAADTVIIYPDFKKQQDQFISMIAPSPDWFAGLDSYDLIKRNQWITDTTLNIFGYDAGTEDGNVFGYNNPATSPQQNITLLTPAIASVIANGNITIAPFATVRFIKQ